MIDKCVMANLVGMYIFLWTPPIDAPSEGSLESYKLKRKKKKEKKKREYRERLFWEFLFGNHRSHCMVYY